MQSIHTMDDHDTLRSPSGQFSGTLRVMAGLLQGLLLHGLYYSWTEKLWPSTVPMLFVPAVMLATFIPVIIVASLDHLPPRKLLIWIAALAIVLCGLGVYDAWRADLSGLLPPPAAADVNGGAVSHDDLPSSALVLLVIAGLFIAQVMLLAAAVDGKRIAGYRSYFEISWKLLVQLMFSLLFTGLFWLVLQTGSALFALIKLDFLSKLIEKSWFNMPATALAFSLALHLSDVRSHIVAGIRKLLLTLLSWLLPVATLIVAAFLLSIPATGLQPLWQTRLASHVLLGAAAMLVIMINTAYQDGNHLDWKDRRFFTACTRLACLLPIPLVLLAAYSIGLRVAEYGWTVNRITAAVSTLIAAVYAIGYSLAAIRLKEALHRIAPTNILASLLILLTLLALLSPLGDPARIAVASQLGRLERGKVAVPEFDFRFLRFEGERYGVEGLRKLSGQQDGVQARQIRQAATQALKEKNASNASRPQDPAADLGANMRLHPAQRILPKDFAAHDWNNEASSWQLPLCMTKHGRRCDAYFVKPDQQAGEQLMVFDDGDSMPAVFAPAASGGWQLLGKVMVTPACSKQLQQAAERGALDWRLPAQRDIDINDARLRVQAAQDQISDCGKPDPVK